MGRRSERLIALSLIFACSTALCQVYRTSFEKGNKNPDGWLPGKRGCAWVKDEAHTGKRCISVSGNGEDTTAWRSAELKFEPGEYCRMVFYHRMEQNAKSTRFSCPCGAGFAYQNVMPADRWQQAEMVFRAPQKRRRYDLMFAQYHLDGTAYFDDVSVEPVGIAYLTQGGVVLGQGEKIENGLYTFTHSRSNYTNCARVINEQNVVYHSGWFEFRRDDSYLIFKFQVGDCKQVSAKIKFKLTEFMKGTLVLDASVDKENWRELAHVSNGGDYECDIPRTLLPADRIFVRMSTDGDANFNLRRFEYTAKLDHSPPDLVGFSKWFRGHMVTVDTGPTQFVFKEGGSDLVEIQCGSRIVGKLQCAVAQFVRKGIGYKGAGVGIVEASAVKNIKVKVNEPKRCVLHVTMERVESSELARKFKAEYEFSAYAGQHWFEIRLLSITNSDSRPYELRGYLDWLQPAHLLNPKPWCFPMASAWEDGNTILGATMRRADDFTLGFRLANGMPHGDVTRQVKKTLLPGEAWTGNEPGVIVFLAQGNKPEAILRESQEILGITESPEQHASGKIVLSERK